MKYFRRILSSIIAIFLCMSAFTGTATAAEDNSPPIDVTTCQTNPIELTNEQQDTLNKIVSVGSYFKYVNNQLTITLNERELKNAYGFSESQYTFLQGTRSTVYRCMYMLVRQFCSLRHPRPYRKITPPMVEWCNYSRCVYLGGNTVS